MTVQDGMRPQLVNLYRCDKVLVEGVTMQNSPFWTLHPLFCTNLIVRGVHFINRGPNGDGCDPESCDGVIIENCVFDTRETTVSPSRAVVIATVVHGEFPARISLYAIAKCMMDTGA